jgi:phage terminase large subunit-like protein
MAPKPRTRLPASEPDFSAIALAYARDVIAGRVLACKWVKLAAKRQIADLARRDWPYRWSDEHANAICRFAELLPHVEGRWETPTIRLEPWQIFGLAVVFGWRRKSDGGRRFSKVYWEVARKNAKSTLAAIVSLYCLCCEDEPAPYVFIGATTGAQAQKVFHPARMMVEKTPALQEAFGLKVWAKSVTEPGGGYIQTINSKGSTNDGHNPHLAVLDELHAHPNRSLYDVMDSAFGARTNPLMWIITTAGFDVTGVCYEQRSYVVKFLEGVLEADHYFGLIYTLDEGDSEFNPAVWVKANPNLGVSVQMAHMTSAAAEAQAQPGKAGEFLTKRMNVWTSARRGHINITRWKACGGPVDFAALKGVPCWGGFDLASVSDLTSFRLVWRLDGRLYTWGTRYLPEAAVEPRTTKNSVPYRRWADERDANGRKLLTVTEGDVTDYAAIEADIRWALSEFNVQSIGYDRWNAQDLCNRLTVDGAPLVEVRQGIWSLTGPMKELDRLYLSGALNHGGDPVLTWCASNVVAKLDDAGNMKPSKALSSEKIDDYTALLNAMAAEIGSAPAAMMYDDGRGILLLG